MSGIEDSFEWLTNQLRRYTYRPGWSMTIARGTLFEPYRLVVRYHAPDSRSSGRTIPLVTSTGIPYFNGDADFFAKWLANALFDVELHESREWLRRDGAILDDPHARP